MTGTCQSARKDGASAASANRDKAMTAPKTSPAAAPISEADREAEHALADMMRQLAALRERDQGTRDFTGWHQHLRWKDTTETGQLPHGESASSGTNGAAAEARRVVAPRGRGRYDWPIMGRRRARHYGFA
jgi:hypothetical protein